MSKQLSLEQFVGSKGQDWTMIVRKLLNKARQTSTPFRSARTPPIGIVFLPPSASPSGSVCEIALSAGFPPIQPTGIQFPTTVFSGKARSFNPAWFQ